MTGQKKASLQIALMVRRAGRGGRRGTREIAENFKKPVIKLINQTDSAALIKASRPDRARRTGKLSRINRNPRGNYDQLRVFCSLPL